MDIEEIAKDFVREYFPGLEESDKQQFDQLVNYTGWILENVMVVGMAK